jgi:hypothetical protein
MPFHLSKVYINIGIFMNFNCSNFLKKLWFFILAKGLIFMRGRAGSAKSSKNGGLEHGLHG